MNFGEALKALKNGKQVYRKAWHGKQLGREMYVYLKDPSDEWKIDTPTGSKRLQPFLALVIGDQVVYGWLASHTDMLMDDWEIL